MEWNGMEWNGMEWKMTPSQLWKRNRFHIVLYWEWFGSGLGGGIGRWHWEAVLGGGIGRWHSSLTTRSLLLYSIHSHHITLTLSYLQTVY